MFSILGTIYGGDGRTTFSLPDLRGRVAMSPGSGPGLSAYQLGRKGGVEQVSLNTTQIPNHGHAVTISGSTATADEDTPSGSLSIGSGKEIYVEGAASVPLSSSSVSVGNIGGNQSHENREPYLAINYIICLEGLFHSRN